MLKVAIDSNKVRNPTFITKFSSIFPRDRSGFFKFGVVLGTLSSLSESTLITSLTGVFDMDRMFLAEGAGIFCTESAVV